MLKNHPFPFVLLFTALALFAFRATSESRDPATHFFNESFGDFQEELETARDEDKQAVMIFFEMDDCPFCDRMKRTILNKPAVQDYFREHFKLFMLDIEGDVEVTDFSGNQVTEKDFAFKQHRVRATPVIAFFDLRGKKIMSYTGAPRDAREFMWIGEFIAGGHYQNTNFMQYKRKRRKQERQK